MRQKQNPEPRKKYCFSSAFRKRDSRLSEISSILSPTQHPYPSPPPPKSLGSAQRICVTKQLLVTTDLHIMGEKYYGSQRGQKQKKETQISLDPPGEQMMTAF